MKCRGLTLLEVMISLFVLGVIMTVLYGAYHSSVDSVRIARDGGEIRQTASLVLERMSQELECAMAGNGLSLVGEEGEMNGRPADQLTFCTSAGGSGRAELMRVSYGLMADPEGNGLILARTEERVIGPRSSTGGARSYELARMAVGLDFVYQDKEGDSFEGWSTESGEHLDLLPSLILVRLTLGGPAGEVQKFTTGIHPELSGARPLPEKTKSKDTKASTDPKTGNETDDTPDSAE